MHITRNSIDTNAGPSEWFTGTVYIDTIATPSGTSRLSASSVHFTPGARTAWHTHPNGQTIHVTEGIGLAQRREGPIEVIRPGDRVFFEPDEDHWHGAGPQPLHDSPSDARRRRRRQQRHLGRPRHRRGVRGGAADRRLEEGMLTDTPTLSARSTVRRRWFGQPRCRAFQEATSTSSIRSGERAGGASGAGGPGFARRPWKTMPR